MSQPSETLNSRPQPSHWRGGGQDAGRLQLHHLLHWARRAGGRPGAVGHPLRRAGEQATGWADSGGGGGSEPHQSRRGPERRTVPAAGVQGRVHLRRAPTNPSTRRRQTLGIPGQGRAMRPSVPFGGTMRRALEAWPAWTEDRRELGYPKKAGERTVQSMHWPQEAKDQMVSGGTQT